MQTLLGYKFKYEFVKGELNILPDLLSCNPAMYLMRGNKDPQVTVILESSILPAPGPLPPHTPATAPVVTSQLLAIDPSPSSEAAPPLALPSTLLHNGLVAQHSSPDGQAICTKLSPDSASNGPYTLKDRIIYQNNKVWVPKELQLCVMTEHHNPPCLVTLAQKSCLNSSGALTAGLGSPKQWAPGLRSVSPVLAPNQTVQGTTASSIHCSSHKARGHPFQLTLWWLSLCWEVLTPSWW
ncbi:hypothetical protein DSO57_1019269 [Entomophthora muscae]|uniref:Uncharacterized protein n=1 Tax=Entomophthora muscae TaxID=34485 RepID=A0ACC2RIN3_9FUNG|nr:hypothetical protein DSO57_1019269 [Entomophthora muscae]